MKITVLLISIYRWSKYLKIDNMKISRITVVCGLCKLSLGPIVSM